jgi:hypothetical protein
LAGFRRILRARAGVALPEITLTRSASE